LSQDGDSLRVRIESTALPRGSHGAHIHAVGLCTPPGFDSAGPHWNPAGRQHGKNNPAGMHLGDLPNLEIDAAGRGTLEYVVPSARMTGGAGALLDGDGSAVVVHATADDYRTDPSGNSGGRIACAAFR
jgi:Cu-Zn family superoxide dismutase